MEGAKCKNFSCTLTFSSQMHLGNINLGIFRGKGVRAKRGFSQKGTRKHTKKRRTEWHLCLWTSASARLIKRGGPSQSCSGINQGDHAMHLENV